MEEIKVFEDLFDKKIISILKILFKDHTKQYYLQELSKESNVPMATTSRILNKLNKLEIIEITKISRFKLYRPFVNKKVELLSGIFKEDIKILDKFIEKIKGLPNLHSVVLHGKKQTNRANILLIGDNMDPGIIKTICSEIKEQYNFIITPLSLNYEQYAQMSQMGLYSGEKKVLFGEHLPNEN
jgi:DNA-binding Lrp family transcriptional regulator